MSNKHAHASLIGSELFASCALCAHTSNCGGASTEFNNIKVKLPKPQNNRIWASPLHIKERPAMKHGRLNPTVLNLRENIRTTSVQSLPIFCGLFLDLFQWMIPLSFDNLIGHIRTLCFWHSSAGECLNRLLKASSQKYQAKRKRRRAPGRAFFVYFSHFRSKTAKPLLWVNCSQQQHMFLWYRSNLYSVLGTIVCSLSDFKHHWMVVIRHPCYDILICHIFFRNSSLLAPVLPQRKFVPKENGWTGHDFTIPS